MGSSARRLRWCAYAAAAASLAVPALSTSSGVALAKGTTWAARGGTRVGGSTQKVVVQARAGHESAVAAAIRAAGGTVDAPLPIVDGFAAHVPAAALAALRARPDVRAVTVNSTVRFAGLGYDDGTTASTFVKASGANTAWQSGNTGQGVGVAVIDTGIAPMNDFSGRLVHGPDLSGEGTLVDTYGHGTVMGGIIGGSGADSANNASGAYTGVAPGATLVAVKVAGRNGAADVSTMLQAMHWVSAYKDQFNIRVLNLSWGTDSTANPAYDPVNYAVERLWRQGIVVVASAGNSGSNAGTITKPGDDPVVITAGAYDDKGDTRTDNDSIPQWTSRGPTAQGVTKPDVIAPGRTLVAQRSYGSTVEQENPKALISPSYIRGSGTSEAAAVVSGVAALLVKAHPDWTPDQVKAALKSTALPMPGTAANTQGAGRVQTAAALAANPSTTPQTITATGTIGSLEASRGSQHVQADCGNDGTVDVIRGEIDVFCNPFDGAAWSGAVWSGAVWSGANWSGAVWSGAAWSGGAWSGAVWSGGAWSGGAWSGAAWSGASWSGANWSGANWSGANWSGVSWSGAVWSGSGWTSAEYTTDDLFLTAFYGGRPKAGLHVNGERSEPRQAAEADD